MVNSIGRSTSPSTANVRNDISGSEPASFRYDNPGAQYPSVEAAAFGQTGYGIIGGGLKIARFPSPVNGAASNFDLLNRDYTGMTIGAAGRKWTGAHGFGVPGYDPNSMLTKQMVDDPSQAIPLLKAIANRESGRGNNLTEEQWRQAHQMFEAGSADAYLDGLPAMDLSKVQIGKKTGAGLLKRALEHIGEEYENVLVPKDDPNWKGPWDCAEFMSWLVYQEARKLYGCTDDKADPSKAEAYTGAWKNDAERLGKKVSVAEAAATPGGIVLRYPPGPGKMGHIALCDGNGGTVEAKGERYGVVADTVHGRTWHTGVLVPGIKYKTGPIKQIAPPELVYELGAPNMNKEVVVRIQQALLAKGFSPGAIDGEFGPNTRDAVVAFQEAEGLTVDGQVGPETAEALGISLTEATAPRVPVQDHALAGNSANLLILALLLLSKEKSTPEDSATPGQGTDAVKLLLPPLLQSLLTGKQVDTTELLTSMLTGKPTVTPAPAPQPPPVDTASSSRPDGDLTALLLPLLYQKLTGTSHPGAAPAQTAGVQAPSVQAPSVQAPSVEEADSATPELTPVNAALGQMVGKALDGRKTGIGIFGLLITTILPIFFPELAPFAEAVKTAAGGSEVVKEALQQAPTQIDSVLQTVEQVATPVFAALTGWGILGKLDKWFSKLR